MSLNYRTFQSAGQISTHIIPGGYSRIDSVKGATGLASANNGVVMGQCTGGQPNTLLQFNTIAEAVATLRSGPLMEAVRLAFNPGGGLNPQRIFAIRINAATQATLDLVASAVTKITLTSRDYGLYVNQIEITVETSTDTFGKKVTIAFQSDPTEVFDNVWRKSFSIENTGGASSMTIVNTSAAQTLVTTTTNALSIDLNDYNTIGELATYINAQTGYTCSVIAGQENASPLELDGVTSQDINAAAYEAASSMQAMIDVINAQSARVSAAANNAATDVAIVDNSTAAFLTGAVEGDYTTIEWTAALVVLEAENIQFISTPDDTAAVHAPIKVHCETMSAVTGRKERQFLVGAPWKTGTLATDITSAQTAAHNLNSKTGLYAFNGGTQRDVNGVIQNYSGSYAGCMLMGMKCTLAINQPLTFKNLNFIELEYKLTDSNLEALLQEGVATINYAPNGQPRLVRQFNTYQTNDLKWNEFSVVTEMFFASRDLRGSLENQFVGQPGTAVTGGVLKGAVEARLAIYQDLGIFIKNPEDGLSWWGVEIILNGDQVFIDYDAYVTLPINFNFITQHFHELVASV
jgi:hypothetical protein